MVVILTFGYCEIY